MIIPDEFKKTMVSLLGEVEAANLFAAISDVPSVSIRLNRKKAANPEEILDGFAGCTTEPVTWCRSGHYLDPRPDFTHDPLFHAGTYYVQEAASMIYETIIAEHLKQMDRAPGRPLRVLDLCAAPGGKSTAMLNSMSGDYVLVANEFDRSRAGILRENLNKWGDPNVIVTSAAASSIGRLKHYFDIVAVDAPCSGEGMMRREPIACSQWSPRLVEQCARLQREILEDVLPALHPGGLLVYSTCTFNSKENEENRIFLIEEKDLESLGEGRHFMPHRDRCEGLYVALFRKPEGSCDPVKGSKRQKQKIFIKKPASDIFLMSGKLEFVLSGDRVYAMPPAVAETFALLHENCIRIISAGVEAGVMKGTLFVPSSRQVLSTIFDPAMLPMAELSETEAIEYLRRNPVELPANTPHGYVAVSYQNHPLGLVKNIGRRANNLYPQEWRVKS